MMIKKGNLLKDLNTEDIYKIESIKHMSILLLSIIKGTIYIVFECTIDFAERNFELI